MADTDMVAAFEPDGEVALAAIGAGLGFLSRRGLPDDAPPVDLGAATWLGLVRGGLVLMVFGVWGVFGFEDSLTQMAGGAALSVGFVGLVVGVLGGAALASLLPPPRAPEPVVVAVSAPRVSGVADGVWSVEVPAAELGPGVARRLVALRDDDAVLLWGLVPYSAEVAGVLPGTPRRVVLRGAVDEELLAAWREAFPELDVVPVGSPAEAAGVREIVVPDGPLGPERLALHEPSGLLLVGALALHVPAALVNDTAWAARWEMTGSADRLVAPFAWRLKRQISQALRGALASAVGWPVVQVAPAYGALVTRGEPAWRELLASLGVR